MSYLSPTKRYMHNAVDYSVCSTLRDSIRDSIWGSVSHSVVQPISMRVWNTIDSSVNNSARTAIMNHMRDYVF
jgi:hypothetical protein